jgi:hypothetical protein
MHMNSTFTRWAMGGMLAASLAGGALGATIRETCALSPSGEKAAFEATPDAVRSFVENGRAEQSVTLTFKASPDRQRHIVKMYVYISRAVSQHGKFEYREPVVVEGRRAKPGAEVWELPQDGDHAPVLDLSDQSIVSPTKVYVYVIEADDSGRSYSTLVETHYAALYARSLNTP